MMTIRRSLLCLLCALALLAGQDASAQPPTPATPIGTSTPLGTAAPPSIGTAAIGKELGQSFQALISGTAAPVPAKPVAIGTAAPPAAATAIGTTAASAVPETGDDTEDVPVPTFGSRALNFVIVAGEFVQIQATAFITNFAALPQLSGWFDVQTAEPHRGHWVAFGNDLLHVVGGALLAAVLLECALYPLRRNLRARKPTSAALRYGAIAGFLGLRALPIMLFIGLAVGLLEHFDTQRLPRFMILNVVYAVAVSRIFVTLLRGLLAPAAPQFRLIPLTDQQAGYFFRWLSAFSLVIVYGYFLIDIARAVHVPEAALAGFANIQGLLLVVMTVVVILQKRAFAASLLRGNLSAGQPDLTALQSLRLWLARRWHILAISYLVIGYGVAALGVRNGFTLMLRGTVCTLLVLAVLSYILRLVSRRFAQVSVWSNETLHYVALQLVIRLALWVLAASGIAWGWGANVGALFSTEIGHRILGSAFSITVTIVILALIYEAFSSSIERHLKSTDEQGNAVQASARMRTLLPMARNTLLIIFAVIISFVIMTEAGVNVGPLLAGAGVVGVAVGFGSQTLVKDFLTGIFIVIENTMAIGDVVKIGTHSGVVEAMNMRSVKLRDGDGAIHTLAFSDVTQVINMTRDFGVAQFSVNVAHETDLEHAMDVLRQVGQQVQDDPIFRHAILSPIQILGVDSFGPSYIVLQAQIKTQAGKHWDVKRLFLLRMKQAFDREGIVIPYPTTVSIRRDLPADANDIAEAAATQPPPKQPAPGKPA